MSLTISEEQATRKELQANFKLSGLTVDQVAADLQTTPDYVDAVLELRVSRIEDPWILRNYLNAAIQAQQQQPIPYSRLNGSPLRHWFLNQGRIRRGSLED